MMKQNVNRDRLEGLSYSTILVLSQLVTLSAQTNQYDSWEQLYPYGGDGSGAVNRSRITFTVGIGAQMRDISRSVLSLAVEVKVASNSARQRLGDPWRSLFLASQLPCYA